MTLELTLGPLLFHWPAEYRLHFYKRIAEESPIDTVYLGEVICSKRSAFFDPHLEEVAEQLEAAGKKVVFTSLAEVMLKRERVAAAEIAQMAPREIELNNAAALLSIDRTPHRIGQYFNVYNEATMSYLAARGATHFALHSELPKSAVEKLAAHANKLGARVEVQVFGRASLAVSARCYHARSYGRTKDNCQFVCENDPDGLPLSTLDGQKFLAINGIQTLSQSYLNLQVELDEMRESGVGAFRLSPHNCDMVLVAKIFRDRLDGRLNAEEAEELLGGLGITSGFSNGFWYGKPGHLRVTAA